LRLGVAVREAVASAHDTTVHHGRHHGSKHTTRYTLHSNSIVEQKRVMREAAQRGGSGVGKVSDANMG
jgi:hypothetical protein